VGPRARLSMPSRSGDADRGAAAVEFALLLPIFVMLAFGTLTGGQAYVHKIGLTQAAREGARFGATLPMPPPGGTSIGDWLEQVRLATVSAAGDDFRAGQDSSTMCVAFIYGLDNTKNTKITMTTAGSVTSATTGTTSTCWSDGVNQSDNRVQVEITRQVDLNIGVKVWHPTTTARSVIHYERTAL
jgi:Flp pilus assembly protein TadG